MNERQVRDYVHKLRRFYTDVLIYGLVNLGLILIWAISGGGYFWPIWVIVGWGIGLGVHAFSLGLIPQMNAMIPFMTAEWEDEEVRRLMEAGHKENNGKEKERKEEAKPVRVNLSSTPAEKKVESKPTLKKMAGPTQKKVVKKKVTKPSITNAKKPKTTKPTTKKAEEKKG
jgi:hypothetical protein